MIAEKFTYSKFKREREIADLIITLPKPPPKEEIANYNLPKKEQKFSVIQKEIQNALKTIHTWTDEERSNFEDQQWERRENGFFFFNGGYCEYVTGLHYFYLGFWQFPVVKDGMKKLGLPNFYDSDRDQFYHWNYCDNDPLSFGQVEITNRRDGKTERGLCTGYEKISKTPESKGGMQSKNNRDGKDIFDRLIKGWQKLPQFFKPIDTGESHPKSSLRFFEPSKRDTKKQVKQYTQVLRSEIDFGTAKDEEYDGEGIFFYFGDEIGKTDPSESNVYNRWYIVKECLADGSTITGKAKLTTTVEEITRKGLELCKRLWEESDPNKRNAIGQTTSGLYKYFKPAFYGLRGDDEKGNAFIDEFGYSKVEIAKAFLDKKRIGKLGVALASEKHKYPFTEAECFILSNIESPLDTNRIYEQIDYNSTLSESTVVRGNFVWVERDIKAKFVHDPEGRWRVVWVPDEKKVQSNKFSIIHGKRTPGNMDKICSAVDPFDHKEVAGGKKSDASSLVRYKFDPLDPINSKFFSTFYLARPPKPEFFYEDMIIQSFFYGTEILPEINKIGLNNYFRVRGYEKYLMSRPDPTHTEHSKKFQKEPGIPMTGDSARNALIDALVTEVYDNVGYIEEEDRFAKSYFDELLLDLAKFEVDNWTPYDASVAAGLCLLAERKYIVTKREPQKNVQFFREYKNKGEQSVRVK